MPYSVAFDLAVFAFGLIIGSYLNVVVHRLPRGISTVRPRSRCPRCRARIGAWDNVPLLSFLWLRGRCRHCGGVISWRYPMVETVTGLCFVASFRQFGDSIAESLVACAFCAAMIVLAMIDLEHFLLPDVITWPGIATGLLLQPWISWSTFTDALAGAFLGAAVLYLLSGVWRLWKGVWGMGFGDVKMIAMVGAFLGWQGAAATLFLASLSGSVVGVISILTGRMGLKSKLPFGFFLALGAIIALLIGRDLLTAYLRLVGPWWR